MSQTTDHRETKQVYLGIGSNFGQREENIRRAIERLDAADIRLVRRSSLYETEPVCRWPQPWFLNAVVGIETSLMPLQLLHCLQQIERELGRRRLVFGGPRTIDIDILIYESAIVRSTELSIPHPRMTERRFVLWPLREIAPGLRHPVTHKSVAELLGELKDRSHVRLWRRCESRAGCI